MELKFLVIMNCVMLQFLTSTICSKRNNTTDFPPIINKIPVSASAYDNDSLLPHFTMEEFRLALFQMDSNKSPGPDGLNPVFFKKLWHLCGHEMYHTSISWLETGTFPLQINRTTIALVPKHNHPTSMKDFGPISLCNVLYKII